MSNNITTTANMDVAAREIDFVTRFASNWDAMREVLGIMRPIKKTPGTVLTTKKASVVLATDEVAEGADIPYSQARVDEVPYGAITVEKFLKGVTLESINKYGYDVAVAKTDNAFLAELQAKVTGKFYSYLNNEGAQKSTEATWKKALAMAKGNVINQFKKLKLTATGVVGFVNVLDLYEYLGDADVTVQTKFGFQYIKDYLGYNTIILLSDEELQRGRVIATPIENIDLYYVDPADSDFAKAGLAYTTDGETNLIGFHVEGNYKTAVSDSYAIMGMTLFSEYVDGIAVVDVAAGE